VIKSMSFSTCRTHSKSILKWSWVLRRKASLCREALRYWIRIFDIGTVVNKEANELPLNGRQRF